MKLFSLILLYKIMFTTTFHSFDSENPQVGQREPKPNVLHTNARDNLFDVDDIRNIED